MKPTKRNYRATFILDNRGKDDSIDQIVDIVKADITAIEGEISGVEAVGRKDFARITDAKFPAANYVQITFAAPAQAPSLLRERVRLNHNVYRTFVESV